MWADTETALGSDPSPHPLAPEWYRVVTRRRETTDVVTLGLTPPSGRVGAFRTGQFHMLTAPGVGEAAISISSEPTRVGVVEHTIRDVGAVSRALSRAQVGEVVGVRGPFGSDWGVNAEPRGPHDDPVDTVVIAGGIGLAPLRGAIRVLINGARGGVDRVYVLVGARQPDQVMFAPDLRAWSDAGALVEVTVDVGTPDWKGNVGLVTSLLGGAGFEPARTKALICGPEIMMRFSARGLVDMGVEPERILVSLERNMQCGLAWCGHCQLGPYLLCRDGPVLPYAGPVADLLTERER